MSSYIKHNINANTKEYIPKFPNKYGGEYPILVRSEWERQFMQWLDINPNVISWASESVVVEYFSRLKNKKCRYYPDFLMQIVDITGKKKIFLVEIKPYKEVHPPKVTKKKSEQSKIYESATYITNIDKWNAAEDYCKKRNWEFKILTERELFKK
jgi:hypothetical protein